MATKTLHAIIVTLLIGASMILPGNVNAQKLLQGGLQVTMLNQFQVQ
ncbi:MAG: hypothetical protein RLZZ429_739 [Bacteroidota bacterium]|jgi:predicted cation transporter